LLLDVPPNSDKSIIITLLFQSLSTPCYNNIRRKKPSSS
jgi:hypothetical protein